MQIVSSLCTVQYLGSGSEQSAGSRLRDAGRGSEGEGWLGGGDGGGAEPSEGRFGGRRLAEGPRLRRRGGRAESPERRLRGGRRAKTCESGKNIYILQTTNE